MFTRFKRALRVFEPQKGSKLLNEIVRTVIIWFFHKKIHLSEPNFNQASVTFEYSKDESSAHFRCSKPKLDDIHH